MARGAIHGIPIAPGGGGIRPAAGTADRPGRRDALAPGAFAALRAERGGLFAAGADPHTPARREARHRHRIAE